MGSQATSGFSMFILITYETTNIIKVKSFHVTNVCVSGFHCVQQFCTLSFEEGSPEYILIYGGSVILHWGHGHLTIFPSELWYKKCKEFSKTLFVSSFKYN